MTRTSVTGSEVVTEAEKINTPGNQNDVREEEVTVLLDKQKG